MKQKCVDMQEAILKCGWVQEDLSDEQLLHAKECEDCARVLDEPKRIAALLKEASTTPPTPDCRMAVMNRIQPRSRRRPVFAYAFALLLLFMATIAAWHISCNKSAPGHERVAGAGNRKVTIPKPDSANAPRHKELVPNKQPDKIAAGPTDESTDKPSVRKRSVQRLNPHRRHRKYTPLAPDLDRDIDSVVEIPDKPIEKYPVETMEADRPFDLIVNYDGLTADGTEHLYCYTLRNNQTGDVVTRMVFTSCDPAVKPQTINDKTNEEGNNDKLKSMWNPSPERLV